MAGFTIWKVFVDVFFPIAFVLLVLMIIPAPRNFRKLLVTLVDRVLGFPLIGNFQLLHVVLVCTGASFGETARQTIHYQQQRATEMVETPNVVTGLLAKKWRAERNFWLSFFCFTLWCLVAAFYHQNVKLLRLEDQLAELEGRNVDGGKPKGKSKVAPAPSAPPLDAATEAELKKAK